MKAKDIKLTVKNADACDAIDRGASNLQRYFDVGEEIDVELDTISDGLHTLFLLTGSNPLYKTYKELVVKLHDAHDAIDKFNDVWQKFYEDIPG
jgi:hypothetical protein